MALVLPLVLLTWVLVAALVVAVCTMAADHALEPEPGS